MVTNPNVLRLCEQGVKNYRRPAHILWDCLTAWEGARILTSSHAQDPCVAQRICPYLSLCVLLTVIVPVFHSVVGWAPKESVAPGIVTAMSRGTVRPRFQSYEAYFGELHQHTGYSPDGCGLPSEAILNARRWGNDFVAITEHHYAFRNSIIGSAARGCLLEAVDPQKWLTLGHLAEDLTQEGVFVVLRGYEYTPLLDHVNVFNSSSPAVPGGLDDLFSWLAAQPKEVVAQLNHPLSADSGGLGDFGRFSYYPPVANRIRLIETDYTNAFFLSYPAALEAGWRVSAVGHSDGHDADTAGSRRYGVFAPAMTRSALVNALQDGRTFGNTDGHLAAALVANGQWMGAAIRSGQVTLDAYAAETNGDLIARMELVGSSGVITACTPMSNPATFSHVIGDAQPGDAFFLHVLDSRGDHAWSGSIIVPRYQCLALTPAAFRFESAGGAEGPQSSEFVVQANDGADLPWQATALADWVQVFPTSGEHLPASVTLTVSALGLASGTHTAGVAVEALEGSYMPFVAGVAARCRERTSKFLPHRTEGHFGVSGRRAPSIVTDHWPHNDRDLYLVREQQRSMADGHSLGGTRQRRDTAHGGPSRSPTGPILWPRMGGGWFPHFRHGGTSALAAGPRQGPGRPAHGWPVRCQRHLRGCVEPDGSARSVA